MRAGASLDLPTGRRGQVLAVALTVSVLAAVWVGVIAPLADWYGARAEQLGRQQALLARMQALAHILPALRKQESSAATNATTSSAVLADATDAVAGATLQGAVQGMASNSGGSLTSAAPLPPEAAGAWRRIGVRVTLRAPWPVLVRLMQSVETASPRMFIDDLQLHAETAGPQARSDIIEATLAVYAFRAATPAAGSTGRP